MNTFHCAVTNIRCSLQYATQADYQNHLSRCKSKVVLQQGSKCLFCASSFSSSLEMLEHLRQHMPQIMLKCKNCPAYFMQEKELVEHAKSHTKQTLETNTELDCEQPSLYGNLSLRTLSEMTTKQSNSEKVISLPPASLRPLENSSVSVSKIPGPIFFSRSSESTTSSTSLLANHLLSSSVQNTTTAISPTWNVYCINTIPSSTEFDHRLENATISSTPILIESTDFVDPVFVPESPPLEEGVTQPTMLFFGKKVTAHTRIAPSTVAGIQKSTKIYCKRRSH